MNPQKRENQGGSIVTFIVVALMLSGLVIGGVYVTRQYGEDIRFATEDGQTDRDENLPQNDTNEDNVDSENRTDTDAENSDEPETTLLPGDADDRDVVTPPESKGAPVESEEEPAPEVIPQTGPAESIATMLVAALITFSGVNYIRSRRIREN